jgi:hypothetical protein
MRGKPEKSNAKDRKIVADCDAGELGRVLINAGIAPTECPLLGANRTRRDGGHDVNDPERS